MTAPTRSFPIPCACRSGRTVIGPKNPTLPPVGDEIRPDQLPVQLRGETGDVLSREPAIDIVEVGPEILRVGRTEKRAEGGAEDAPGCRQIAPRQRSNYDAQLILR